MKGEVHELNMIKRSTVYFWDFVIKAGNLCTREYSVLRFFGFGAGFA